MSNNPLIVAAELLGIGLLGFVVLLVIVSWLGAHTRLNWRTPTGIDRNNWIDRAMEIAIARFGDDDATESERVARMVAFMNQYFEAYHVKIYVTEAEGLIFFTEHSIPTMHNILRKAFGSTGLSRETTPGMVAPPRTPRS